MSKLVQAFLLLAALPSAVMATPPPNAAVPEAGILPLLGMGLVAAALIRRRLK